MRTRCCQPRTTKPGSSTESNDAVPDSITIDHADDIRTLALSIDEPIDWARFGVWLTMLLNRHGEALLRIKGILNVAGR